MRKSLIVIAGLFVMAEFGSTPPSVQAAVPLPFSTEFTQLLNYGQLLSVNLTAATQLANEIQQLQNSSPKPGKPPEPALRADTGRHQRFGRCGSGRLFAGLLDGESGCAVYKPLQRVRRIHAEQLLQQLPDLVSDLARYDSRHVAGGGHAGPAIAERTGRTDFGLRTMAQTSDGAMEALQVLGQISEQEVQQLMKLRELMLADLQSKQAFQAATIQQQANAEAAAQQFFQFGGATGDGLTFLPGWR
jgi:hypothetical protein